MTLNINAKGKWYEKLLPFTDENVAPVTRELVTQLILLGELGLPQEEALAVTYIRLKADDYFSRHPLREEVQPLSAENNEQG